MVPIGEFLEHPRQASMPILYTISTAAKGTPLGEVAVPLKRRESEAVLYPNAFDKFMGCTLKAELDERNCRSLIIIGSATNFAVLYRDDSGADLLRCGHPP
jgi:hypothetical protein